MATHASTATQGHTSRLTVVRVGLWLFILSEAFLFGAILTTRFYLQGVERPDSLNQPLGLAITIGLLISSLAAYRAEMAAAYGDQKRFLRNSSLTLGLGLLFLVGVGTEWKEAIAHFPPHTGFGTVFFVTTGIHAFHVITGLLALALVMGLSRNGRFTTGSYWGVEGAVKYWHFVDVAWVFIYPTLYLVS
jgi:cytochrome c oxidase subunit 3